MRSNRKITSAVRILAALALILTLSAAMILSSCDAHDSGDESSGEESTVNGGSTSDGEGSGEDTHPVTPDDEPADNTPAPNLSDWDGVHINGVGGDAVICGDGISVIYDAELDKNVLSLSGDGYLSLPSDIWKNTASGFTIAIKAMPDESTSGDANIFTANISGYGTGDTSWRDAPELSLAVDGGVRLFVGGRTINGVYNPAATYNNGTAGDDKAYAEPRNHKTRYSAATKAVKKSAWTDIIISVSPEALNIYYNGELTALNADSSLGGNLASSLEYLFGDYRNGDYILEDYVNVSIGNSVYGDIENFNGKIAELRIYERALSEDEAAASYNASLPAGAAYKLDFEARDIIYGDDIKGNESDLTKYKNDTKVNTDPDLTVSSPDGSIVFGVVCDSSGSYYYNVTANGEVMIENSALGLIMKGCELISSLTVDKESISYTEINESYEMITGSGSIGENNCNELCATFNGDDGSFDLIVRVYDDGAAYRYSNVRTSSGGTITVTGEATEIILPYGSYTWSHSLNGTYEAEYVKRSYNELDGLSAVLSTPMLVQKNEHYMLITEASIINNGGGYCKSALGTASGGAVLSWRFGLDRDPAHESTGELDSPGHINITSFKTEQGFSTPWRTAVISSDLNAFTTTDIISNLNPAPSEELFADTSWIKPGKVAWSWWSEDAEQGNFNKHIEYIDFAADNGWEYVCLDAHWRNFEERLPEMCEYADERGVGIFVWVNYRDIKLQANMERLFSEWASAGVVGLKTDYFESDAPNVLLTMERAAECSARNRLMILYHGCVHPGGESRTYPNIMTVEAVLGEEAHKWSALPTVENCLLYPFIRNICGPMDYTPAATRIRVNGTTNGFGLAMTVVYESALQHLASSAHSYRYYTGLSFLNNLSVSWDESQLIDGAPGEYVTFMRRSGDDYYIGSMTAAAREVKIPLSFLPEGEFNVYLYRDSDDGEQIVIDTLKVTSADTLTLDLLDNGGAAAIITVKEIDTDIADKSNNLPNYTYYEAESGYNRRRGAVVVQTSPYCSGGEKVGYIGYAGNTLTFENIQVDEDGIYTLLVSYCCGENRSLTLTVNGNETYVLTGMNSGDFIKPDITSVEISLTAGMNSISLSNPSGYAPDIDRIALSKTHN